METKLSPGTQEYPPSPPETPSVAPRGPAPQPPTRRVTGTLKLQNLKELGQTQVADFQSNIFALPVVGQIEGHLVMPPQNKTTKYEHIIPQLVAIEQNPAVEGVLLVLNTVGGDVEAGLAIAEMVASLSKPKVSLVLGGGHSIGVPVAVATDFSFIAETATMTIHPIRLTGLGICFREEAGFLGYYG